MQLRDLIADRLKEYINAPNVTVTVTEMKGFNVFVQGEVGKPGMHPLQQEMTLLHLISLAGGVTEKADLTRAYLLRNNERMPVDFYKLLRKGDQTQNVTLKPNDLIMIPDNFDQRVTVVGEVSKPQVIPFREGMTVMDAILEAGDFTNFARRNGTKIVRRNGGETTEIQVKITDITRKGDMSKNIPVLPGDTILVPRSLF
jgi:polysaccharide export outer membrane protein